MNVFGHMNCTMQLIRVSDIYLSKT